VAAPRDDTRRALHQHDADQGEREQQVDDKNDVLHGADFRLRDIGVSRSQSVRPQPHSPFTRVTTLL
jgi:hypothetical protein